MLDKKEIMVESLSSLSESGACKKRRRYKAILGDTLTQMPVKNTAYKRAEVITDTIINALKYNEKNSKHIMEFMNGRFVECGFINPQQKKQMLISDWHRVMRYISDESRLPSFPKGGVVKIHDEINPIRVKPDVAFECGSSVEYVIFKIGKPHVTQSGDKNQFQRDLQLYSLIKYGRDQGFNNITASFYFLKKDNDTTIWAKNEPYFFGGGGGNIVNMVDPYFNGSENELDDSMSGVINKYVEGINEEDQSENNCKYCPYANICQYKSAPIAIEEE